MVGGRGAAGTRGPASRVWVLMVEGPQFQRDLGLTADQAARSTPSSNRRSLLRQKEADLDRQEDELSRMIAAGADESLVTRQVDKVESTRASMNKMRTLMLLHEPQVLTPDQRVRLNKLHEQMFKDKDRGKSRDKRN